MAIRFSYFLIICFSLIACSTTKVSKNTLKPNVIFFLVDDMGWMDLSCYGSTFHETPNIDRLAKEGIRFTNAYASCPVCSPTRASILTGKHPARLNITDWIPGSDPKDRPLLGTKDQHELPLAEQTIAEVAKEEGYATAFLGKWHLGKKGYFPEDQGFDINIGGHSAGQPASYFYPYKNVRKNWDVPHLENGKEGEYLTDRLTQEAIQFMSTKKEDPFLLYLAYYSVHTPIQSKRELEEKYSQKRKEIFQEATTTFKPERENITRQEQDNPAYAGMVQSVDESVGAILKHLDQLGLTKNTTIIFTSDNGGLSTLVNNRKAPASVLPLRAGKGWLYEGGIRVPAIIKWPKHIQTGRVSDIPITSTDYYPTLVEMLSATPSPASLDGQSLVPLCKNEEYHSANLYWHFPHYHGSGNKPSAAIRSGNFKLIEWMEDGEVELYDLEKDIGEEHNLIKTLPDKGKELQQQLREWQQGIGALFPTKNPAFQ